MTAFIALAALMTGAAIATILAPLLWRPSDRAPVAAILASLVVPLVVVVTYVAASNYPWPASPDERLRSAGPGSEAAPDEAEIDRLRAATVSDPSDLGAWIGLGNGYASLGRFADARDAYRRAMPLEGSDNQVRMAFAEAAILADPGALTGEPGAVIDEVLRDDPSDARALWYGGMSALARSDPELARQRWTSLLALSPPPAVQRVLEEQLAALGGADPVSSDTTAATPGISVRVTVAPALRANIRKDAPLFVIARAPGAAGPPLAVVRRDAGSLPMEVLIGEADVMMPGQSLAALDAIALTARVANGGEATTVPGDLFGDVLWRRGSESPVEIVMDQVAQ